MKKKLLFLLPVMLLLCACNKQTVTTITVMTEGDTRCWQELTIENVEIVVEQVPRGTIAERVLSAEKKPNIVCLETYGDMEKVSDLLLDIERQQLDGYDRARFADENYKEIEARHATSDGKHIVFPNYTTSRDGVEMAWLYRADVFEELGLEVPETMSELSAVCRKLKNSFDKCTPMAIRGGYDGLDTIAPAWKNDAAIRAYYDFTAKKWCYGLTEPWAGNFVSFWANMAKNKFVPSNYLSISDAEIDKLVEQGKTFVVPDYVSKIEEYKEKYPDQDWRIMPPPKADIATGQHKIAKRVAPFSGVAVCSGSGEENQAALKVIDGYFMKKCTEVRPQSGNAKVAEIYTENNVNPARYIPVITDQAEIQVRNYFYGALPAFLRGEIPMKRWAKYAERLKDKGIKNILNNNKKAYGQVQK